MSRTGMVRIDNDSDLFSIATKEADLLPELATPLDSRRSPHLSFRSSYGADHG
jgi:hypothetical protein